MEFFKFAPQKRQVIHGSIYIRYNRKGIARTNGYPFFCSAPLLFLSL